LTVTITYIPRTIEKSNLRVDSGLTLITWQRK